MKHPYKSEAELCDAFVEAVKLDGWKPYPECGGFDLLLVKDGVQVGVEAKMRANCDVLEQALDGSMQALPMYVGVLVPTHSQSFGSIAHHLKVHVWDHGWIINQAAEAYRGLKLKEWWKHGDGNVSLPEVAIQTSAGKPSPKTMSAWRIKALKICLLYERQGYLTRADIVDGGVDASRWTRYWMQPIGTLSRYRQRPVTKYGAKAGSGFPSHGYEPELEALRTLETP